MESGYAVPSGKKSSDYGIKVFMRLSYYIKLSGYLLSIGVLK